MPKPLPTGANLEHLKKQAKGLLKSARTAESNALARHKSPPYWIGGLQIG